MSRRGTVKVTRDAGSKPVKVGDTLLPRSFSLAFTTTSDDGPDYVVTWEVRKGVPVCASVAVTAKPRATRGVLTGNLQELNLRSLLRYAVARVAIPAEAVTESFPFNLPPIDERAAWAMFDDVEGAIEQDRTRRRGATREGLERVADIYRANVNGAPVRAVEVELGLTPRTAARRVEQARAAGLLPPTSPGKRKA